MEESCGHYVYRECRKNYAAPVGGHAVDGCGEFVPAGDQHGSGGELWCAACGCHRSFHRKVPAAGQAPALALEPAAGRKRRARTKFTEEQKERMREFAERVGWRTTKGRGEETAEFLGSIGVSERAFRIWMHNHRHTSRRAAESSSAESDEGAAAVAIAIAAAAAAAAYSTDNVNGSA